MHPYFRHDFKNQPVKVSAYFSVLVTRYPGPKLSLPGFIFRFQLPVNDFWKIVLNIQATQMGDLLLTILCVVNGDAAIVIFNIEAGNYYSKSTFIKTNKTWETCVHIGYFIHSGVFTC